MSDSFLRLNYVTNTEEYGERPCLPVLCFLSLMSIFLFITGTDGRKERGTRARVAENDVPLTDRRGIDAEPRSR